MNLKILDLFCGAGGAAAGYFQGFSEAGFSVDITGVDINHQPRYPFNCCQGDALEFFDRHGHEFNFLHASPPCQKHSVLKAVAGKEYPCFIEATRGRFKASGKPYCIENVVGAPLEFPITLCGLNFGIPMHGHRLFECRPIILSPPRCQTNLKTQKCGRKPEETRLLARPAGHFAGLAIYRQAMGVPWMSQSEIAQCIPPAFTRWIAGQMLNQLSNCDIYNRL
ncbi:DNA cytosine methyltransferase [Microcoleus sp. FACHB-672]|uniref:DNA cytosine methyltransferase n=1 Tax=Microcoleus sp. FACHB-672 TaxID=2692825 RepID=UPI001686CE5C|nr:DNA cytosine methyltransferase [Microcoleus sp. FACHB-672]MBD2039243.1 DNA cytosine methyltransferase [Microcoleus sp. FACHB-672]